MNTTNLTTAMIDALKIAAGRKSGLISAGHSFPTALPTLKALATRNLVVFKGKGGPYYDRRYQYQITEEGRALAATI